MLGAAVGSVGAVDRDSSPKEILDAILSGSEAAQRAREFEAAHGATILNMHLDALSQSDKQQTDINLEDSKSGSMFKGGWRPMAGWTCVGALQYQFLVRPLVNGIMPNIVEQWSALPLLETDTLMTLLFGLLGLGAYRTVERIRGKA